MTIFGFRLGSKSIAVSAVNPLPITAGSGEAHVGQVGAAAKTVRVEKTRPADANAYSAFDAIAESDTVGTIWTFAVGRIVTGSGVIVGAQIATDHAANTAILELDLYDASITAINDNAEATRLYANQGKFLGTIIFPSLAKKTTNSTQAEADAGRLNIPFACVGNSSVYGILRTPAGFTPTSGSKYTVTMLVLQD